MTAMDGSAPLSWADLAQLARLHETNLIGVSKRCTHVTPASVDLGLVYGLEMARAEYARHFVFLCCAACRDHVVACKGTKAKLVTPPTDMEAVRREHPCSNCNATGFSPAPEICQVCRGTGVEPDGL